MNDHQDNRLFLFLQKKVRHLIDQANKERGLKLTPLTLLLRAETSQSLSLVSEVNASAKLRFGGMLTYSAADVLQLLRGHELSANPVEQLHSKLCFANGPAPFDVIDKLGEALRQELELRQTMHAMVLTMTDQYHIEWKRLDWTF